MTCLQDSWKSLEPGNCKVLRCVSSTLCIFVRTGNLSFTRFLQKSFKIVIHTNHNYHFCRRSSHDNNNNNLCGGRKRRSESISWTSSHLINYIYIYIYITGLAFHFFWGGGIWNATFFGMPDFTFLQAFWGLAFLHIFWKMKNFPKL